MKIFILAVQFKGGSLQVVLSLINEFRKFSENDYIVITSSQVENQLDKKVFPKNFVFYSVPYFSPKKIFQLKKRNKWFSQLEAKFNPDCVLSTSGPVYWRSKAPHLMGYNLPANIYPESPFFINLPLIKKIKWRIKKEVQRYFFRKEAEAFFVQTEDVNIRLRRFLSREKVYTISNTFSGVFENVNEFKNKLPVKVDGEFRLLTISTYYPHKHFEIIIPVIRELEKRNIKNVVFVLTLQQEFYYKIFKYKYQNKVINLGPVNPIECPSLYKECDVMFLPSLLECFSASYAEAMVMQKPILTTDLGFAHTVCNDAALYFEPGNPKDIADKIVQIMMDLNLISDLIQRGTKQLKQFGTAEDRANQVLKLCNQIKKII